MRVDDGIDWMLIGNAANDDILHLRSPYTLGPEGNFFQAT